MSVTKQRLIDGLRASRPRWQLTAGSGDAAVALVISGVDQPAITLCVKAPHLRRHAGEVSLPGGKVDTSDADSLDAARRELTEETGIVLPRASALGSLDQIYSLHGLRVTPHVFWSEEPLTGYPNEPEIAKVFRCPLHRILDAPDGFEQSRHRDIEGLWMPRWVVGDQTIWGLTALILANFRTLGLGQPIRYPNGQDPFQTTL